MLVLVVQDMPQGTIIRAVSRDISYPKQMLRTHIIPGYVPINLRKLLYFFNQNESGFLACMQKDTVDQVCFSTCVLVCPDKMSPQVLAEYSYLWNGPFERQVCGFLSCIFHLFWFLIYKNLNHILQFCLGPLARMNKIWS